MIVERVKGLIHHRRMSNATDLARFLTFRVDDFVPIEDLLRKQLLDVV